MSKNKDRFVIILKSRLHNKDTSEGINTLEGFNILKLPILYPSKQLNTN